MLEEQSLRQELILDHTIADVTGDRLRDQIWLTGMKKEPESPHITNIAIIIQDAATSQTYRIQPKENSGYNPRLFVGDFTGDGVSDILVTIDSGGSGATTYDYLYTFVQGKPQLLFSSDAYNEYWKYTVSFLDGYRLRIINSNTSRVYTLDITSRGKEYLDEIYNTDGTLKSPIEGWVDPLSGLYPVDFDGNGVYELLAFQGVSGRYHADSFGYIQNALKWQKNGWILQNQWLAIYGAPE
ncbi:spore coat protein [Paenibacillus crassostreae]|uniref:Spore coat protein n=1 Tax=Paenibacillus crassostreae TaxID=1763538 RepID=A0A167C8J9_9BACL|nr:spore coat protein [Paenibacillus crassostreae]